MKLCLFFEKKKKLTNLYLDLQEKTLKIRYEKGDITTDIRVIQSIRRGFYEQLNFSKLDNYKKWLNSWKHTNYQNRIMNK